MSKQSLEAKAWLKNNKNQFALATNRFETTKNALAFVEKLYKMGAVEVLIEGVFDEEWRIKQEGGPYSEALTIMLPDDGKNEKNFLNYLLRKQGMRIKTSLYQKTLV